MPPKRRKQGKQNRVPALSQEARRTLLDKQARSKHPFPPFVKADRASLKKAMESRLFAKEYERICRAGKSPERAASIALYSAAVLPHFFSVPPLERTAQRRGKQAKAIMHGETSLMRLFSYTFPKTAAGVRRLLDTVAGFKIHSAPFEVGVKWHFLQAPDDIVGTGRILAPIPREWGCRSMCDVAAPALRNVGAKNVSVLLLPHNYFMLNLSGGLHAILRFEFKGKRYIADPFFMKGRLVNLAKSKRIAETIERGKGKGVVFEAKSAADLVKNAGERQALQKRMQRS